MLRGMPVEHPNARLLRDLFAAFEVGDLATITGALAEDVRWHTPGSSLLAGSPAGRDAVLVQLGRGRELSGGTYRIEVLDVLAGDHHAAVVYRGTGEREGRVLDLEHVALYRIADGVVTEVFIEPLDQPAFDAFWS